MSPRFRVIKCGAVCSRIGHRRAPSHATAGRGGRQIRYIRRGPSALCEMRRIIHRAVESFAFPNINMRVASKLVAFGQFACSLDSGALRLRVSLVGAVVLGGAVPARPEWCGESGAEARRSPLSN